LSTPWTVAECKAVAVDAIAKVDAFAVAMDKVRGMSAKMISAVEKDDDGIERKIVPATFKKNYREARLALIAAAQALPVDPSTEIAEKE